jgi:hypothetical protein
MEMKSNPKTIIMIDPPKGWLYGFPKELPEGVKDVYKWLVENGYPQHIINNAGDSFQYRCFEIENK